MSFYLTIASNLQAGVVKTYGVQTQADLTTLAVTASTFSVAVCDVATNVCSSTASLTWTILVNGGNVGDPGGGKMNSGGWELANQYLKISNVQANSAGWVIDIYTDNLHNNPPYTGPLLNRGSINGAVSNLTSNITTGPGGFLLPLTWKVTASTISYVVHPMPEEATTPPFACPISTDNPHGLPQTGQGFCDFATHYMGDLGDVAMDPFTQFLFAKPSWWQAVNYDPLFKAAQLNYQSVLTSDGAGTGDFYRLPYPTLSTLPQGAYPPYYLYIAADLAPGTVRAMYQTIIFMNIVTS